MFYRNKDIIEIGGWMGDTHSRKCFLREWIYVNLDAKKNTFLRVVKYFFRLIFGPMKIHQWERAAKRTLSQKNVLPKIEKADLYMMTNIFTLEQYRYQEICTPGEEDVVFDCGACVGDTAVWFAMRARSVVAFEPDLKNYKILKDNLSNNNIPNVICVLKGVSEKTGSLSFASDFYDSSKVSKEGDVSIEVCSIDDYCHENGILPTFIKMDIEGAEICALKGAKEIICTLKPKLAICIYHEPLTDMIVIPKMLREWRPDYKFYCRKIHHYRETVLYAV
jgi:FkbM family methyltransferase